MDQPRAAEGVAGGPGRGCPCPGRVGGAAGPAARRRERGALRRAGARSALGGAQGTRLTRPGPRPPRAPGGGDARPAWRPSRCRAAAAACARPVPHENAASEGLFPANVSPRMERRRNNPAWPPRTPPRLGRRAGVTGAGGDTSHLASARPRCGARFSWLPVLRTRSSGRGNGSFSSSVFSDLIEGGTSLS